MDEYITFLTINEASFADIADQINDLVNFRQVEYPHTYFVAAGEGRGRGIRIANVVFVTEPPTKVQPTDRYITDSDADYIARLLDLCARK